MEFIIKMAFEAQSKPEAEDIANDLLIVRNSISRADLKTLCKLLKENPGIVQVAKKYLGK